MNDFFCFSKEISQKLNRFCVHKHFTKHHRSRFVYICALSISSNKAYYDRRMELCDGEH